MQTNPITQPSTTPPQTAIGAGSAFTPVCDTAHLLTAYQRILSASLLANGGYLDIEAIEYISRNLHEAMGSGVIVCC